MIIAVGAVLIVAGGVYAFIVVRDGFSTRDKHFTVEAFIAETARRLAILAEFKDMNNPIFPSAEVYAEACAHYAKYCAQCHASNGSGDTLLRRGLYPRPPDMRLPLTQNKTDGELYYTIQSGIRLFGMPAFGEIANDPKHWRLVALIRHLPKQSHDEEKEIEHREPKTPDEMQKQLSNDRE